PVPALLFIARQVNKNQPIVRGLELRDGGGSRVGIKLSREQNVVDDDVGVKVVSQIPDTAVEIEVDTVAEPEHGVRRVLMHEFQHPAALIERAGSVLADVDGGGQHAGGLVRGKVHHARADNPDTHATAAESRRPQLIQMQDGGGSAGTRVYR